MFFLLIAGCSNDNKIEGNKIVVHKQVNETNKYELYREIKDSKEVQNAKDILSSIKWKIAKVDMAHPPEYKFNFEDTNNKTSGPECGLWISPKKDKISLYIGMESKYIQLDKEKSQKLFKLITGNNLSEVK